LIQDGFEATAVFISVHQKCRQIAAALSPNPNPKFSLGAPWRLVLGSPQVGHDELGFYSKININLNDYHHL
jgi:hypothetical protein